MSEHCFVFYFNMTDWLSKHSLDFWESLVQLSKQCLSCYCQNNVTISKKIFCQHELNSLLTPILLLQNPRCSTETLVYFCCLTVLLVRDKDRFDPERVEGLFCLITVNAVRLSQGEMYCLIICKMSSGWELKVTMNVYKCPSLTNSPKYKGIKTEKQQIPKFNKLGALK